MHFLKSRLPPVLRRVRNLGQRFGVTLIPNHFYSEIPDYNYLGRETAWRKPSSMFGIAGIDLEAQLATVRRWCEPYAEDLQGDEIYEQACRRNGEPGYGAIEAQVLHGFVRTQQPGAIVQIGCGVSTALLLDAADRVKGYQPRIRCLEPYPTRVLREEHRAGRIELIAEPAQGVDLELITSLEPGDLLFVDSTHTIRPGSEVLRVVLEVLPRLVPGVFVHFHDIYFPYDYGPGVLNAPFLGRESPLLQAFLCGNKSYEIVASLSMIHHGKPSALQAILPTYDPLPTEGGVRAGPGHFPSSTYLRRCD